MIEHFNNTDNKMQCEYCKKFRPISEFSEKYNWACKECRNNPYHLIDSGEIRLNDLDLNHPVITSYGHRTLGADFFADNFTDGGGI